MNETVVVETKKERNAERWMDGHIYSYYIKRKKIEM